METKGWVGMLSRADRAEITELAELGPIMPCISHTSKYQTEATSVSRLNNMHSHSDRIRCTASVCFCLSASAPSVQKSLGRQALH